MSSQQQGSCHGNRRSVKPIANRHIWTPREGEILIGLLKELIAQGWKSDNGFRPGFLNRLEDAMRREFSTTDLRAIPNIQSKITAWKKSYNSLAQIMNRSGVGYNTKGTYMIDCEDDTWEQIVRADPYTKNMRYKSWPLFDVWKEIFGKDHATGEAADDVMDTFNDIMDEINSEQPEQILEFGASLEPNTERVEFDNGTDHSAANGINQQAARGKRRKVSSDIREVCNVLERIGQNNDARLETLAGRISIEYENLVKQKKDAFAKIEAMTYLTVAQRFDVCDILSKEVDKLEVFHGLSEAMVPSYVEHLLYNKGH